MQENIVDIIAEPMEGLTQGIIGMIVLAGIISLIFYTMFLIAVKSPPMIGSWLEGFFFYSDTGWSFQLKIKVIQSLVTIFLLGICVLVLSWIGSLLILEVFLGFSGG